MVLVKVDSFLGMSKKKGDLEGEGSCPKTCTAKLGTRTQSAANSL